jgi:DNA repair protein RadA/Sms
MASSYFDTPVPPELAVVGEIGLSGELRAVSQLSARLSEAAKLGFTRVLLPRLRRKLPDLPPGLKLLEARNIGEALALALPKK